MDPCAFLLNRCCLLVSPLILVLCFYIFSVLMLIDGEEPFRPSPPTRVRIDSFRCRLCSCHGAKLKTHIPAFPSRTDIYSVSRWMGSRSKFQNMCRDVQTHAFRNYFCLYASTANASHETRNRRRSSIDWGCNRTINDNVTRGISTIRITQPQTVTYLRVDIDFSPNHHYCCRRFALVRSHRKWTTVRWPKNSLQPTIRVLSQKWLLTMFPFICSWVCFIFRFCHSRAHRTSRSFAWAPMKRRRERCIHKTKIECSPNIFKSNEIAYKKA